MRIDGLQLKRRLPARVLVLFAATMLCALPASSGAQVAADTRLPAGSGAGAHLVVGVFAGWLDLHAAGETELVGGRAGVGLGELVQLTGFYWRGVDRSSEAVTADYAWGGELQLNLNTGFGLTPFVTGGVGRVDQEGTAAQTAAIAGAGLTFPLGPVLLHAAARDYMYGVTGLRGSDSPENVTHNWLYSAGVTFALGRRRPLPATVASRPEPEAERAALRAATAELAALRDSLRAAGTAVDVPSAEARTFARDSANVARNYQSAQRIEIPIPTEGSITLRYGPERTAPAAPIVVTVPGGVAGTPVDAAAQAAAAAASLQSAALPPDATLTDPAAQAWLQQLVATQVTQQLAAQRRAATAPPLTPAQVDALVQRVQDGVLATAIPRLDATQAARISALREELRLALADQREQILAEFARQAALATPAAPVPVSQPPTAAAPVLPVPAPPGRAVEPEPAAAPGAGAATVQAASAEAALAAARAEAAQRTSLAAAAAAHPTVLAASETERGPAAVLGDAAFESGSALLGNAARAAVRTVAEVLRAHPDRRIYVHGHTDGVGTELQNQRLSELRAETVRSLLVQEGIEPERLFAVGYGHGRPVADDAAPHGRALNRRVEIVIGETRSIAAR